MTRCLSSYAVSYEEMVELWVEQFHPEDNLVIIYDPQSHIELLREAQIELDEQNMFSSKILILIYFDIVDTLRVVDSLAIEDGPYAQAWIKGRLVKESY